MSRRSYLSIDLDYWSEEVDDTDSFYFFERVFDLGLPILVVESHEQLLDHVNKSGADTLYNVDYHSDFTGFENKNEAKTDMEEDAEDGTWINYVDWRWEGTVHWMYPKEICYGSSQDSNRDGLGVCWTEPGQNPFKKSTYNQWKHIKKSVGYSEIDWDSIVTVGFAISAYYLRGWWDERKNEKNLIPFRRVAEQLRIKNRIHDTIGSVTQGSSWKKTVKSKFKLTQENVTA